jgi:hypothetical protein
LIGDGWSNARFATGPLEGQRRIEHRDDFVRLEIMLALDRDIPVIPVFIGKVTMADIATDLPPGLERLTTRNAATLRGGAELLRDLQVIAEQIELVIPSLRRKRPPNSWWKQFGGLCVMGMVVWFTWKLVFHPKPPNYVGSMQLSLRYRETLPEAKKNLPQNRAVNVDVLPLQPGDRLEFQAKLDAAAEAYFYLVQIDSDGSASIKYPPVDSDGNVKVQEKPRNLLAGVDGEGGPIVLKDALDGIQSVVWFVRDHPLTSTERKELDELLKGLKWKLPDGWQDEKIVDSWENGVRDPDRSGPQLPGEEHVDLDTPKTQTVWLCAKLNDLGLAQYSRAACYSFKQGHRDKDAPDHGEREAVKEGP